MEATDQKIHAQQQQNIQSQTLIFLLKFNFNSNFSVSFLSFQPVHTKCPNNPIHSTVGRDFSLFVYFLFSY